MKNKPVKIVVEATYKDNFAQKLTFTEERAVKAICKETDKHTEKPYFK